MRSWIFHKIKLKYKRILAFLFFFVKKSVRVRPHWIFLFDFLEKSDIFFVLQTLEDFQKIKPLAGGFILLSRNRESQSQFPKGNCNWEKTSHIFKHWKNKINCLQMSSLIRRHFYYIHFLYFVNIFFVFFGYFKRKSGDLSR